jgi:large subunit ribosomal protein L13
VDKTYVIKGTPESKWVLVDANGKGIGRVATDVAHMLLGKHKPTFTPGVAMGDFVVVINVEKLAFTEKKGISKVYYKHSNYPGGLKAVNLKDQNQTHPDRVLRDAVWGMLPHNNLGRQLIKRLKIYAGSEHPHTAQTPEPVA